MHILYVAVFDDQGKSNDISAARAMADLMPGNGREGLIPYPHRIRLALLGKEERDNEIIEYCQVYTPDLVFFVKCDNMDTRVFEECKKICPIAFWFADPLVTFRGDSSYLEKAKVSNFVFVDKKNVQEEILPHNPQTFIVADGFDKHVDVPHDVPQDLEVTFIGNPYGDRSDKLRQLDRSIGLISNAFGSSHAIAVSRSKINLNFCTSDGPSNRVYKVLAAGGFLLSDDWLDREKEFEDGKHLVVFKDMEDARKKIAYYLEHEEERQRIAEEGHRVSHKYTRHEWARKVLGICLNKKGTKNDTPK